VAPKIKIIRDNVYGYVEIDPARLKIIDTRFFQRLKRIKQLTAFSLYPSANQTRFEHSIGVMFLGDRVLENLKKQGDTRPITTEAGFDDATLSASVTYACLLHDIGHAAFSHIGEHFYDKARILADIEKMDPQIHEAFGGDRASGSKHELMSVLVILKHFRDSLPKGTDLELVCRMITGNMYPTDGPRKGLNAVVSILHSTYDVDRLDYVLRDSHSTGTFGVSIDYERILRGYAVKEGILLFLRQAIPSVVSLVTGRDFLYQWLYNHHTVAYTDLIIERTLREYLPDHPAQEVFSLQAVEDDVDDSDVWAILKTCAKERKGFATRIFERKFHKAVWKTPYEFDTCPDVSSPKRNLLLGRIKPQGKESDSSELEALEQQVVKKAGLKPGDILVSVHQIKHFDPLTNRDVHFWVNERAEHWRRYFGPSPWASGPGVTDYPLVFFDEDRTSKDKVIKVLCDLV